ncbi:MAG: alpha/beta hydrolase [Oscillospiraceae bacterium]|nr:alpha/beta hydrolase [Oscillospiraceae bacterium]
MKKALKITGKILLGILIIFFAFILVMFIYHRIMLHKEKPLLESPLGQMVEVDGHNMSIYTEGEGEHTLIIMSGGGEVSPILGYSSLYSKLSDTYKIAVIEKFGYGFSDVVDGKRDFDTILRQDREALHKAGVEAPYILCPHSMSGIEAILWAQKYPDEVEAIVGLDMSTPKSFTEEELSDDGKTPIALYTFLRESGLGRLVLTDSTYPDHYDQHEKDIYKALTFRKFANKNIEDEVTHISDAINEINSAPKPDVPTLLFLSDGEQTGGQIWIDAMHDYADGLTDAQVIELNCGHIVTEEKPDEIAAAMREFIEGLDR